MGMPSGPTVLPFKSEKISFSLTYKNAVVPTAQVELACLCFDREGQVLDYVQFNRRAALNGSLKHSSCSYLPAADAVPGDEAIHMFPFDFAPQCEVMLLLASAPHSPLHRNDLGCSGTLQFRVTARELGKEQLQLVDTDLSLFVGHQAARGAGPLSNGHQTMVVAGVFTTPQGWTLSFDCTTFPEDHWGVLLPQLRTLLQRWPTLLAAEGARRISQQRVVQHNQRQHLFIDCRKGSDQPLTQLAAQLWPCGGRDAAAAGRAMPAAAEDAAADAAGSAEAGMAGDAAPDPPADAAAAAAAVSVDRLVLELGWEVFQPQNNEEEEEEEPPAVEFALTLYNLQGEELAAVTADDSEAAGVMVDEEEPEVPEEPEGQQEDELVAAAGAEAGVGAAAEAAGGGQADDDELIRDDDRGDDDADRVPEEEDEETKAAKVAARAEAAAAAAQRAAASQRPLAERMPLKRKIHLVLSELPADTRTLVLTLSNFAGGGFKNVKSLHARLLLAEAQQQGGDSTKEHQEAEEGAEPGEEEAAQAKKKKGPRPPDRVLASYRFDSCRGADAHMSQAVLLKLYREYPDSAFAVWQQQHVRVADVATLLGGAAAVAAASSAAAAGGNSELAGGAAAERAKEVLQLVLGNRKQLERDLAELRAKAEEEGMDDDEEGERDLRLARGVWRVRVLGVMAGGDGPDDLADTLSNLLAYDGELDAAGKRCSGAAKVAFPNRDTYFGGYEADVKSGVGLYVFANGAAYVGQYAAGRRQGQGLMVLPDGGLYRGGFVADRFEGQGAYLYPDNSCYTGAWAGGRKHGAGTYWDTAAGCLRGVWAAGLLKGRGEYDQPHYHFEGTFAKGLPAGPCSFTMCAFRSADLPQAAASYIITAHGPTLCGEDVTPCQRVLQTSPSRRARKVRRQRLPMTLTGRTCRRSQSTRALPTSQCLARYRSACQTCRFRRRRSRRFDGGSGGCPA